jgi:methionine-rich copper-binding protein CopC/putative copper export protein/ABC-type branched-subunit amino acid transport system substrate-binding protein
VLRRLTVATAVALVASCGGAAVAAAHPLLLTAAPAPGVIDPSAPKSMTLEFSEAAVTSGSRVTITGPHRVRLPIGKLKARDGGRLISFSLPSHLKPGVYKVAWLALGIDGHNVDGTFAFGIAEKSGRLPPGSSGLGGAGTGALGGNAQGQSPFSAAANWLGVAAAALALGGLILIAVLRRAGLLEEEDELGGLHRLFGLAWVVAVLAAIESVIAVAGAGASSNFDPGLLTASGTGISAIARAVIALVTGVVLLVAGRLHLRRLQALAFGVGGFGLLATYGLSGHVIADGGTLAKVGMVAHVACAGIWAGGVITLFILAGRARARGRRLDLRAAARAFAPVAAGALVIAGVTGVIAAVREVDHWYFLRFSTYGNVVIVKVAVVALAAGAGAANTWRRRPRRGLLGFEAGLVVAAIGIATVLSGLAQGRGQPLPAQRGDLLPGPAFGTALLPQGSANVTLTPARTGLDSLIVNAPPSARRIEVRMACGCDVRPVISRLARVGGTTTFSSSVPIPSVGSWYAYLYVNGHQAGSPVSLPAGVPTAPGAPVQNVLSIADLSGPGAERCREFVEGLDLAIGRLNGLGGVDGGDKVALDVLDDGGSPARAAALAARALTPRPVAFMPCGAGAEPALALASRDGVPSIVGDPATGIVYGPRIYRVAADPYADGYAIGQAIRRTFIPQSPSTAKRVLVVAATDAQGQRRLAGLKAELRGARIDGAPVRIRLLPLDELTHSTGASLYSMIVRTRTIALVIDGTDAQEPAIAAALRRLPARSSAFTPATVFASDRLLSERLIDRTGTVGQLGVIQGTSEVAVDSDDALALANGLPSMFPGATASIESLRGFVTGQALSYAVAHGTSVEDVTSRLFKPAPFTDALADPWRSDAPAAGDPRLGLMVPNFLNTTLLPQGAGGEQYTGDYFAAGAWERTTSEYYGPSVTAPVPRIGVLSAEP